MIKLDAIDTLTRGAAFLDALEGRPVTVVGFAREAAATVRRLHAAGAHVRRIDPTAPYTDLTREALVVVTKAASLRAYAVAAARSAGVPVLSALDFAWCATKAEAFAIVGGGNPDVCVRIVTSLLAAHERVMAPLTDAEGDADALDADVVLVQPTVDELAAMQVFRPSVAVLLPGAEPIAPRLLAQQTPGDCVVLSAEGPDARAVARTGRAHVLWLSATRGAVDEGVFVTRGRVASRLHGRLDDICGASGIADADLEPVLVAVACGLWMGLVPESIGLALARDLHLEAAPVPVGHGVRFASGSVRSLLRGGARALFGHPAQDEETAPVTTGAR